MNPHGPREPAAFKAAMSADSITSALRSIITQPNVLRSWVALRSMPSHHLIDYKRVTKIPATGEPAKDEPLLIIA